MASLCASDARVVDAVEMQQQPADRVGRAAAVVEQFGAVGIAGAVARLLDVLHEGGEQVGQQRLGQREVAHGVRERAEHLGPARRGRCAARGGREVGAKGAAGRLEPLGRRRRRLRRRCRRRCARRRRSRRSAAAAAAGTARRRPGNSRSASAQARRTGGAGKTRGGLSCTAQYHRRAQLAHRTMTAIRRRPRVPRTPLPMPRAGRSS